MKRTMVWGIIFSLGLSTHALAAGPGTTNANFLKASQGVRPIAMGETYIALGNGLDTLYWNPAGLVQQEAPALGLSHSFWFQDISTEYLAYGTPLGPLGAFGVGLTVLHTGAVEETLEDASGNYAGTGGQYSALELALVAGYAQKLGRLLPGTTGFLSNVLIGGSLRIINENIADGSLFGGGLDVGALWRDTEVVAAPQVTAAGAPVASGESKQMIRDSGLRFGLVAQNLGMTTDKLMPMNFRAGAGYVVNDLFSPFGRATLAADVLVPIDNEVRISLGGEYAHLSENTEFAARVGYKIGSEIKDLDALAGLTAGLGVGIRAGLIKYQIDYAFVPYGELGSTHRAALTLAFFPGENVIRPAAPALVAPLPSVAPARVAEVPKPKPAGSGKVETPAKAPAAPAVETAAAAAPAAPEVPEVPAVPAAPVAAAAPVERTGEVASLIQALERLQNRIKAGLQPGITFKRGDSTPLPESKAALDQLGRLMETAPGAALTVIAYGTDQTLATARAEAVCKYLTMTYRVSRARLATKVEEAAKQPKNTFIGFEAKAAQ